LEEIIEREISERNSAHLPPTYRLLSVDTSEAKKVIKAISDLPGIEVIGPIPRDELERIIIKAKFREFASVITRLYEINRVNSLRRKPLMRISIDPFNL
jgi:primosomal protein N'